MALSDYVNTFGQHMIKRHGSRVHKLAINAGFTCPNRDGIKGIGGCTFCNNVSFSPNARKEPDVQEQISAGRKVIAKRTGAKQFIAYFQAYTNTYDHVEKLSALYDAALAENDVIGISVGTRPDCVPTEVLALLASYLDKGHEVWLELGLQSSFNETLDKVNRGHGLEEYLSAIKAAQQFNIPICTHLIIGLPGENRQHVMTSLDRVLKAGVQGLKLHPLHVVKGTQLANEWRRGEYQPLTIDEYISIAADVIEATPSEIVYHRVTGTAATEILLAPSWCNQKWNVLNGIEAELAKRHSIYSNFLLPEYHQFT